MSDLVKAINVLRALRDEMGPDQQVWAADLDRIADEMTRALLAKPLPVSHLNSDDIVLIYTDGACSGNPGPGGWGVTIDTADGLDSGEISGAHPATTNNRMEMAAMIVALQYCRNTGARALIRTDSKYVIDGLLTYLPNWKSRGWRTAAGKPVLNQDLWERLDPLYAQLSDRVRIEHVKGHSKEIGNDAVDELAVHARLSVAGQPIPEQKRQKRRRLTQFWDPSLGDHIIVLESQSGSPEI